MMNANIWTDLSTAEEHLRTASRHGGWAPISDQTPIVKEKNNSIRAEYIRYLALGGAGDDKVHFRGIQIRGAWIEGQLDLTNSTVNGSLIFRNCHIERIPKLTHAKIFGLLSFNGSKLPGCSAVGIQVNSSLTFCEGLKSLGGINIKSARILGSLEFDGSSFSAEQDNWSINCEDVEVFKNVNMGDGFMAIGEVRLIGAKINGNLDLKGGCFQGEANSGVEKNSKTLPYCLSIDGGIINGSLLIGDLESAGHGRTNYFKSIGRISFPSLNVGQGIYIESLLPIDNLDISNCNSSYLQDKMVSWGRDVNLDGFCYKYLRNTDCSAASRLKILEKQTPEHFGMKSMKHDFRPQPWIQMITTLRSMGHAIEANRLAFQFQRKLASIGKIRTVQGKVLHYFYGLISGYGYKPMRLVATFLTGWIFFGLIYWYAALNGVFAPSNPLVFLHPDLAVCRPVGSTGANVTGGSFSHERAKLAGEKYNWYTCGQLNGEYTTFSPMAYSLDVLLPFVDLHQEKDWGPFIDSPSSSVLTEFSTLNLGHMIRLLVWLEVIFGWIISLLFVAQVSGLQRGENI